MTRVVRVLRQGPRASGKHLNEGVVDVGVGPTLRRDDGDLRLQGRVASKAIHAHGVRRATDRQDELFETLAGLWDVFSLEVKAAAGPTPNDCDLNQHRRREGGRLEPEGVQVLLHPMEG